MWYRTLSATNAALLRGHHIGTVPVVPVTLQSHCSLDERKRYRSAINMETGQINSVFLDEEPSYITLVTSLDKIKGVVEVSSQGEFA